MGKALAFWAVAMRLLEPQRYAVVVPGHVNQLLACLPEPIASALRDALYEEAVQAARFGSEHDMVSHRTVEVEWARLHFEEDPENRVLIALDVTGELPQPR